MRARNPTGHHLKPHLSFHKTTLANVCRDKWNMCLKFASKQFRAVQRRETKQYAMNYWISFCWMKWRNGTTNSHNQSYQEDHSSSAPSNFNCGRKKNATWCDHGDAQTAPHTHTVKQILAAAKQEITCFLYIRWLSCTADNNHNQAIYFILFISSTFVCYLPVNIPTPHTCSCSFVAHKCTF